MFSSETLPGPTREYLEDGAAEECVGNYVTGKYGTSWGSAWLQEENCGGSTVYSKISFLEQGRLF